MIRTFVAMLIFAFSTGVSAEPIRIIVPFTPGGGADLVARALSVALPDSIVENVPGAGGEIAAKRVAANPGTVLLAALPTKSFDASKLSIVAGIASAKTGVVTRHLALVHYARSNPGKINYASGGIGTATHIFSEEFAARNGFEATLIPFRGQAQAMQEIIAGRIDYMVTSLNSTLPDGLVVIPYDKRVEFVALSATDQPELRQKIKAVVSSDWFVSEMGKYRLEAAR